MGTQHPLDGACEIIQQLYPCSCRYDLRDASGHPVIEPVNTASAWMDATRLTCTTLARRDGTSTFNIVPNRTSQVYPHNTARHARQIARSGLVCWREKTFSSLSHWHHWEDWMSAKAKSGSTVSPSVGGVVRIQKEGLSAPSPVRGGPTITMSPEGAPDSGKWSLLLDPPRGSSGRPKSGSAPRPGTSTSWATLTKL